MSELGLRVDVVWDSDKYRTAYVYLGRYIIYERSGHIDDYPTDELLKDAVERELVGKLQGMLAKDLNWW